VPDLKISAYRVERMMQLTLTDDQLSLLVSILQDTLGEVREEVYKSEVRAYRDELKKKEDLVRGLLTQLGAPPA
jgi:hypothetical protein